MRWRHRPNQSNWGEFGPDDEVGRLDSDHAREGASGHRRYHEGRTFCLSLPLDYPGGNVLHSARHPPRRRATTSPDGVKRYLLRLSGEDATDGRHVRRSGHASHAILHTMGFARAYQVSSTPTAMASPEDILQRWRRGEHIVMAKDHATEAERLGIETMAERCVQGRAVLIDLHALAGDAKADIGFDGLEEAMKAQGAIVETGDMVCFRTGFGRKIMEMKRQPDAHTLNQSCAALDGRDPHLQQWVVDSGVAALISDNVAVERYPNKSGSGRRPLCRSTDCARPNSAFI